MDELVLLAQMHGSGQETVEALRAGGIQTASDVAACDPERLARIAGLKVGPARKMCAEARRMVEETGTAAEQAESEVGASEAPPRGGPSREKPSEVTDRTRPRKKFADVMAAARASSAKPPENLGRARTDPEQDEGVDAEEAAVLGRPGGSAGATPRDVGAEPAFVSFWRFG